MINKMKTLERGIELIFIDSKAYKIIKYNWL